MVFIEEKLLMRLRFYLDMPLDKLTSKEFAKKRFENIDRYKASLSDPAKNLGILMVVTIPLLFLFW